ncbi:hypothetical protein [Spongiactinospora sp. TRM90649]|uniref:hypothetical protein n=1 Tax=Spongiactinospora sp. TRM90649 TaxID=3031114 RepID=UPI0023F69623|nr:hypothetical protein [Spongiactinospora sp. TRM90649]MDF5753789.1 hypothetical protein [Spongiactinospora sp. TRM90649]
MATPFPDPHRSRLTQETRNHVLELAGSMKRADGDGATAMAAPGRVDLFLALLQDRLPVWLRILHDLSHLVGKGNVADNLLPIARAGIDYYLEIQSAALPAFSSPTVTVRYRAAVRGTGLGPMPDVAPLAAYLAAEQAIGRVSAHVDPMASARLLLAGCFQHAYYEMLTGSDASLSRDDTAEEIVRELRLDAARQPA